MKKAIEKIQNKASDEQKLFYATIASGSVAMLLFLLWFAGLNSTATDLNNQEYTNTSNNIQEEQEDNQIAENKNDAAALKGLEQSFFSLTNSDTEKQENNNTSEHKRQPFKLEI